MAEDSRVPPLSRRIPGAAGGPKPAAKAVRPVLPESLLLAARAALSAEADEEEAERTKAGSADANTTPATPHQDPPAGPAGEPAHRYAPAPVPTEADEATQPIPAVMPPVYLDRAQPAAPKASDDPEPGPDSQPGRSAVGAAPAPTAAPQRPAPAARGASPASGLPAGPDPARPDTITAGPDTITIGPRRRVWLIGGSLLALIAVAAVALGIVRLTQSGGGVSAQTLAAERAARSQAASWVASQVTQGTVIACDPVMCRALRADHVPSGQLLALGPTASYPLTASIVIMTATVRSQFGSSLATAYAPAVLARFGSGLATVAIRVISRDGAHAYAAALRRDISERKNAAQELLNAGDRIQLSKQARSALVAGRVGSRLIVAVAEMASLNPISIQSFGDSGPGASPGMPFRSVDFVPTGRARLAPHSAYVNSIVRFLSGQGQDSPYRVASVALIPRADPKVVRIQFGAPGPLDLLGS